jgi:hypothetical protein
MTAAEGFDYERALRDPCGVFAAPGEVLVHPGLDAGQKRAILESWRQDAVRLSSSEGESMGGGEEAMLQRVCDALAELARPGPSASKLRMP